MRVVITGLTAAGWVAERGSTGVVGVGAGEAEADNKDSLWFFLAGVVVDGVLLGPPTRS